MHEGRLSSLPFVPTAMSAQAKRLITRLLKPMCLLIIFGAMPGSAFAQGLSSRAITIVVPYTPSTGPDVVARTVGDELQKRWRQPVVVDNGLDIRFRGRTIHLNLPDLTGKNVMIYGQQEVVKDLIASRIAAGKPIYFEAEATSLHGLDGDHAIIRYVDREHSEERSLQCDFIAGCDEYHGVSRFAVPLGVARFYDRTYDFAWPGVLASARPIADMTYSNSDRGFALCSRRSMEISRLYLQIGLDEAQNAWSDVRFWDELHRQEAPGKRPTATAAREEMRVAAIEREYRAKLDDLRRNYALRVMVEWVQTLELYVPVQRFDVLSSAARASG
jgi:2-polyprenyl-6-methoxyphenol hydroxylase-like FAD-dependent oxidoreductase